MLDYGKLINGKFQKAPNNLISDGKLYINPPEEVYIANGYLPMSYTVMPPIKEGCHLIDSWVEFEGKLIQQWNYEADSETSLLIKKLQSLEEKINELTSALKKEEE